MATSVEPRVVAVVPPRAVAGGLVRIVGERLPVPEVPAPVELDGESVWPVHTGPEVVSLRIPGDASGRLSLRVPGVAGVSPVVEVGRLIASGVHQVDNPAYDPAGHLYLTYSGARGQEAPVSLYRVTRGGVRELFATGIVNPTSMATGPDGALYVSSRFDGTVSRVAEDGSRTTVASDLGVACGLAFDSRGRLHVGDRTGTIFRLDSSERATVLAHLPPSVAAFHLAMGSDDRLYVAGPTLSSVDPVYRIDREGTIETLPWRFGRPQGLLVHDDALYVVDALAGDSGIYRVREGGEPELVVSGGALVGLAVDPGGGFVVCSNDEVFRFDTPLGEPAAIP